MTSIENLQVIIVGSGPAGTSAAWPLVEAGVQVLMLDASDESALPNSPSGSIATFRKDANRWRYQFGNDLIGVSLESDQSPKMTTPLARTILARFATETDILTNGFHAAGSLNAGGLSNIWGAVTALYDDQDLLGYPFPGSELSAYYQRVMNRIGVSGGQKIEAIAAKDRLTFSPPIRKLIKRYRELENEPGFSMEVARNAVLQSIRGDRQECVQCGLCLWGCHRASIYNSAFEIPLLKKFSNFNYRAKSNVKRLFPRTAAHCLQVETEHGIELITAPIVIMAAGTIGTTALVLDGLEQYRHPIKLLNNPVAAMAFIVPELFMAPMPEKSFSLGQLIYKLSSNKEECASGILYAADALPLSLFAQRMPFSRPLALRLARALAPSLVLATCYLPGHYSNNNIQVHKCDGHAKVTIDGKLSIEAEGTLLKAGSNLGKKLRRYGAFLLPGSLTISPTGSDAHYAGTLPMGATTTLGCSNIGELNGCPGLFIADASSLPKLPAKHCTLTVMANASRIGDKLAHRLRKQCGSS